MKAYIHSSASCLQAVLHPGCLSTPYPSSNLETRMKSDLGLMRDIEKGIIPKPSRKARSLGGHPQVGESLLCQMGLSKKEFLKCKNVVFDMAKEYLDLPNKPLSLILAELERRGHAIDNFIGCCQEMYPPLQRYHRGWPVEAFLRIYFSCKKHRLQKHGQSRAAVADGRPNRANRGGGVPSADKICNPHVSSPVQPNVSPAVVIDPSVKVEEGRFTDFLKKVDPILLTVRTTLLSIDIDNEATFTAFMNLTSRDAWLYFLERKGKLSMVERVSLQTISSGHVRRNSSVGPRFIDRFNPAHQNDSSITKHFLTALYPPLPHLQSQLEMLGITTVEDIRRVLNWKDREEELYISAVKAKLMTSLEAQVICDALHILSLRGF